MQDQFKIGQLTKELVAAELRGGPGSTLRAAQAVRKTLAVALRSLPAGDRAAGLVIAEAVRGALQAFLLADLGVAQGGVAILREMVQLASDLDHDVTEVLTSALQGIASLKRLAPPGEMDRIRLDIDAEFHGIGETFSAILSAVPDPGRPAQPTTAG